MAERLKAAGLSLAPIILARQARVALGDGIAQALGANVVVMALGERPGLSAADSLGAYITYGPTPGMADSSRNCISNIRDAGLAVPDAADQALGLIREMRAARMSGVALSQQLGLAAPDAGEDPAS